MSETKQPNISFFANFVQVFEKYCSFSKEIVSLDPKTQNCRTLWLGPDLETSVFRESRMVLQELLLFLQRKTQRTKTSQYLDLVLSIRGPKT